MCTAVVSVGPLNLLSNREEAIEKFAESVLVLKQLQGQEEEAQCH
jgi:hypothetical protein